MSSLDCLYIGTNVNPMPLSLIFLTQNNIAFISRNQVYLYNINQNRITQNINQRSLNINRANCLINIDSKTIVVGYDSGHVLLFNNSQQKWTLKSTILQNSPISGMNYQNGQLYTWNLNAQVFCYKINQLQLVQYQKISFPLNKTIDTITQLIIKSTRILFIGGIDKKIHVYSKSGQQKLNYKFSMIGHQNPLIKMTVTNYNQDFLLASSSKDGYIRIWKITKNSQVTKMHKNVKVLQIQGQKIYIILDAVLIGHQGSVTGIKWIRFGGKLQLASCSVDCTICLWSQQTDGTQGWGIQTRMGQFLGNKNAYFHIQSDQKFNNLVVVNYIGSALMWRYSQQDKKFQLQPMFTGHSHQVSDIDWDSTGKFLVSVSKDQTTRVITKNQKKGTYHQISRAQIHGYDINAVSMIKVGDQVIDLIACGADQKVVRIVQPPASFANFLNKFTQKNYHLYFPSVQQQKKYIVSKQGQILQYQNYSQGGIQVLGLMTKMQKVQRQIVSSYYDGEQQQAQQQQQQKQKIQNKQQQQINYQIPPNDDYMVKHTLWPQMNKLYAHPQQISCLAKNTKKKLLATACQGRNKKFCTVIVWNTQNWKIVKCIQFHSYTVYAMQFSKCGEFFATTGRDRQLAIWSVDNNYQCLWSSEAHSRAITCLSWSNNGNYIATGGRDKLVKLHDIKQKKTICDLSVNKQITSIVFCQQNIVVVGLIDGSILTIKIDLQNKKLTIQNKVQNKYSHTFAVSKLRYNNGIVASSSYDHSVRLFSLKN